MDNNLIQKEVEITLLGKKVVAKFPNIRSMFKIEQMKQSITDGRYAIMAFSQLKPTLQMLDLADAICYLSNTVEDFYKTLGIENYMQIMDMDFDDGIPKELISQYKDIYEPFFNKRYLRSDRPVEKIEVTPEAPTE